MEMTSEKLTEMQERVMSVIRDEKDMEVSDGVVFFAFMLGKVIRVAALGSPEKALEMFRVLIPGIEDMLNTPCLLYRDVADILSTINEINEEKEEE